MSSRHRTNAAATEEPKPPPAQPQDQQMGLRTDLDAAIAQLKAWAQAGTLIRYESGTWLSAIDFMGRLLLGANDSFVVKGAPEYGAAGMCGGIYPSHAEYVKVCQGAEDGTEAPI